MRFARCAPITPVNLERLNKLEEYAALIYAHSSVLRGGPALELATALRRFGDSPRARHWLDVARERNADPKEIENLAFLLQNQALTQGTILGRITLPRASSQRVVVGVFNVSEKSKTVGPPYRFDVFGPAASQWVKSDGSFRFEHLSEGRYYIALLVPKSSMEASAQLAVERHPGIIHISKGNPRFDAGHLIFRFQNTKGAVALSQPQGNSRK